MIGPLVSDVQKDLFSVMGREHASTLQFENGNVGDVRADSGGPHVQAVKVSNTETPKLV